MLGFNQAAGAAVAATASSSPPPSSSPRRTYSRTTTTTPASSPSATATATLPTTPASPSFLYNNNNNNNNQSNNNNIINSSFVLSEANSSSRMTTTTTTTTTTTAAAAAAADDPGDLRSTFSSSSFFSYGSSAVAAAEAETTETTDHADADNIDVDVDYDYDDYANTTTTFTSADDSIIIQRVEREIAAARQAARLATASHRHHHHRNHHHHNSASFQSDNEYDDDDDDDVVNMHDILNTTSATMEDDDNDDVMKDDDDYADADDTPILHTSFEDAINLIDDEFIADDHHNNNNNHDNYVDYNVSEEDDEEEEPPRLVIKNKNKKNGPPPPQLSATTRPVLSTEALQDIAATAAAAATTTRTNDKNTNNNNNNNNNNKDDNDDDDNITKMTVVPEEEQEINDKDTTISMDYSVAPLKLDQIYSRQEQQEQAKQQEQQAKQQEQQQQEQQQQERQEQEQQQRGNGGGSSSSSASQSGGLFSASSLTSFSFWKFGRTDLEEANKEEKLADESSVVVVGVGVDAGVLPQQQQEEEEDKGKDNQEEEEEDKDQYDGNGDDDDNNNNNNDKADGNPFVNTVETGPSDEEKNEIVDTDDAAVRSREEKELTKVQEEATTAQVLVSTTPTRKQQQQQVQTLTEEEHGSNRKNEHDNRVIARIRHPTSPTAIRLETDEDAVEIVAEDSISIDNNNNNNNISATTTTTSDDDGNEYEQQPHIVPSTQTESKEDMDVSKAEHEADGGSHEEANANLNDPSTLPSNDLTSSSNKSHEEPVPNKAMLSTPETALPKEDTSGQESNLPPKPSSQDARPDVPSNEVQNDASTAVEDDTTNGPQPSSTNTTAEEPIMNWAILADDTKSTISDRIPDEPDSPHKSPRSYKDYVTSKLKNKQLDPKKKPDTVHEKPEGAEQQSRKIRFRKPFPILKPAPGPRPDEIIIREHTLGPPVANIRWIKPKPELKKLIVAAMGTSLQRRSNACGALKVLTVKKKNQMTLARTDGFLTALLFTASQDIPLAEDRDLAVDARARAVACLRNVSTPKENRVVVLSHPGIIECFSKVMDEDAGEARVSACAALALLAKSAECREGLVENPELIDSMSLILAGEKVVVPPKSPDPVEDENDDNGSHSVSDHSHGSESSHSGDGDEDERSTYSESSQEAETKPQLQSKSSPDRSLPAIPRVNSIRNRQEDMQSEYEKQARLNACAFLLHLSKHCAVLSYLAENKVLINALVKVAAHYDNPLHTRCLEILRNLSLFAGNNRLLSRYDGVTETFIAAASSSIPEDRIFALRALQNMASDRSSKALLATRPVLGLVTSCAMRRDPAEKEAAVATLYNITTEPSAVVAITNTENVIATLVHLAHSQDSTPGIRKLACEALATTSLWLQTLAGTGTVPEGVQNVLLPSHKTYGWERWD